MTLERGATFGRYVVEASLGGGGMGHVYRAFDPQLQRRIALKILHALPGDDEGGPAGAASGDRILREARAAAALSHAHVVTVFEVGAHEGTPFLAMELVPGESLRSFMGPDLPLRRAGAWLLAIADALAHAHAAGIVHLDVKPENVLVRDDDVVKVLDFGIARRRAFTADPRWTSAEAAALPGAATAEISLPPGVPAAFETVAHGAGIAGTPRYMAPEQIQRRGLDGRTDEFAWGVLAFELLTGQSPWPPDTDLFALLSAIVHAPAPRLSGRRPDVPEAVSAVVHRALEKEPNARFATMAELKAALEQALASAGVGTSATTRSTAGERRAPVPAITTARGGTLDESVDSGAPTVSLASVNLVPVPSPAPATLPSAVSEAEPGRASAVPPTARAVGVGPAPPEPARSRRFRFIVAAITMVIAIAAGVAVAWFRARNDEASTSWPPPGCSPAAERAYLSGARALRHGDWEEAHRRFDEVVALDPECGAAHARLVTIGYWMDQPSKTRAALRRALDLGDRLSPRDRAVMRCYESVLWATPPDERAFAACLGELAAERTNDAELAFLAGDFAEDPREKQRLAERAIALDAEYSDAWQGLAVAFALQDNDDAALEALRRCTENVTTTVDCLAQRAMILRRNGQCADLEATGRQWIARRPEATGGHFTLAAALASQDRSANVVEEALLLRWARLGHPEEDRTERLERAALAVLAGRIAPAEAAGHEAEALVRGGADIEPRIEAALFFIDLWLETDRREALGALADDLWSRKSAWDAGARRVGYNMKVLAFEPQLLRALRATGRMSDAAWKDARAKWLAEARASKMSDEAQWILGHALFASTPEEAKEAVAAMPASITAGRGWIAKVPGVLTFAHAGRVLALAGNRDAAIPLLTRGASACSALEEPILHTQVIAWLGEALADGGARDAACAAFARVGRRWGLVADSLTAKRALERASALGCPR